MYRIFCFFNLFPMVGKGLITKVSIYYEKEAAFYKLIACRTSRRIRGIKFTL